jgi:hypothetical protein
MLSVTNSARVYLAGVLDNPEFPSDLVTRFVVESGAVKVVLDRKRAGDILVDHEDSTVLVFDRVVARVLEDSTLDVEGSGEEATLKLV